MNSQLTSFGNSIRSRKGCKYAKIPLINKIRLFKSVLEEGYSIKTISEKLQIKYSTAKTLVRQYKDQEIKIDLRVLQNETTVAPTKKLENLRCGYRQIFPLANQNDDKKDHLHENNLSLILSSPSQPQPNLDAPSPLNKKVLLVSNTISKE